MFIINGIAIIAVFVIVNELANAATGYANHRNHLIEEGFEVI